MQIILDNRPIEKLVQATREEFTVPNEGLKAKEVEFTFSQLFFRWFIFGAKFNLSSLNRFFVDLILVLDICFQAKIDQCIKDLFEGPGGDIHPCHLGLFYLQVDKILFFWFTILFTGDVF